MEDDHYLSVLQVKQRVGRALRSYWARSRRTYAGFSDNRFYLPTREEIEGILADRRIRDPVVANESFDCDDFTFVFKGLVALEGREMEHVTSSMCVGIAWGWFGWVPDTFHAVNWALLDDGEFVWIEPQDGSVREVEECKGGLTLLLA